MANKALSILIADPQLSESRTLRMELRRRGARVFMAETAEEATRLAELTRPDLFIVDDELRREGSCDLAGFIRSTYPDSEMILFVAQSFETARGLELGLLFAGMKPVSTETLLDLITTDFPGRLEDRPAAKPYPGTVLCVDDDPGALRSLTRLLAHHGYRVCAFEDGRAALQAIPTILPDLAILDVRMPGMDGRELALEIRKEYRGLFPMVMLSGLATSADMASGYQHGADYYLSKTCEPHRLLDVVDYYAHNVDREEREFLESHLPGGVP
jgi:DNA-binding response OmpR family regulator